ncbi:Uncharacterized protein SCF082_LOCUS13348 [Durusdinium trenchii]|uniref:Uncharacterized protein n=1 Tax=Durusdinium trenchii TaxID=1381693 RepID=A0ABP0JR51_9DINO
MAASIEAPTLRTVSSLLAKKEEKVEKKEEVKNESDPVIKKQKTEWADLIKPLLPAITDLFCIPSTISPPQDTELTSFDAIQLSTQGAERQRKDVMKMAMRIEILLAERKAAGGVSDQSDKDLIMEIIGRYNDHKANSAIRRWDYSQDLDAILMSKPASLQVEQISMWQDHVGNALAKSLQRRMLQDSKLDGKDPDKVHHVGYCDLSKWGRLSVPLIDEVSSWAARTLQLNPEMSMVLIICPMLAAIDLMGELQSDTYLGVFSETANSTLAQYVTTQVVHEEATSQGPVESKPMSWYDFIVSLEKKGSLDYTITGHDCTRPAAVQRGEESDRKGPLEKSQFLQMVWRYLAA